jgi:hypothetical protein
VAARTHGRHVGRAHSRLGQPQGRVVKRLCSGQGFWWAQDVDPRVAECFLAALPRTRRDRPNARSSADEFTRLERALGGR